MYFADEGCGRIAFAACEDEDGDAGAAARSCIYLATLIQLRADGWELLDASVVLSADGITLGESQSGTFQALAVSGADQRRLTGSFVACRAVAYTGACR